MNLLKVDNLSIEFDNRVNKKQKVTVLSDINLEVEEGEIVAVVGESGCGKTTLGKLIVGIHKQTKGILSTKGKKLVN